MASSKYPDALSSPEKTSVVREGDIEDAFIEKLRSLKYTVRTDIHDRASLERNFREKFEALNRVNLTDAEFARLLDEIITPDVFTGAKTLRAINSFMLTRYACYPAGSISWRHENDPPSRRNLPTPLTREHFRI